MTGTGSVAGYELFEASAQSGWHWRPVVTLDPEGASQEGWTGYQCITSDGRYAVVVTAPTAAANVPELRDRGAFAYSVDLLTGSVRPLATGVALMYFDPGCGRGDRVVLSRYLGSEEHRTELQMFDARTGGRVFRGTYNDELTSAVPTDTGVLAAAGGDVVRATGHGVTVLRRLTGKPFDLRPDGLGVDFLLAGEAHYRAGVYTLRGQRLRLRGSTDLEGAALLAGAFERNTLVGRDTAVDGRLRSIAAPDAEVQAASSDGQVLLSSPEAGMLARAAAHGADRSQDLDDLLLTTRSGHRISLAAPRGRSQVVSAVPAATAGRAGRARTAETTTTPACAVPRLDTSLQVLQPDAAEVDWAVQQATRGLLKGSVLKRSKNFDNMGLPAYSPSTDFPPVTLSGYPGTPVPRSLIEAILAQESNWDQASFHALPGVAGDPLVADYYGAQGGIDQINYELSDCGYGLGQVTTGMTAAATSPYSSEEKTKIAIDYAENVAASIAILANTWNELAAAGVTLNGGNPSYLENWYFTAWAYNTGFHENTGSGPWGLGWTNNPQNSSYPPSRTPFLRDSYADAAHPADWPYQERTIGFMETPLLNDKGQPSYLPPTATSGGHYLKIPAFSTFCTSSDNCSPTYQNPEGDHNLDYCELGSRECWWHLPVTYAECPANCATSSFTTSTTATEPADEPVYLPQCESILPEGTIIVDDEPTDLNLRGCSKSNWKSKGTFAVTFGKNEAGTPIGEIDFHQLGTGFGGHLYFTHNRASSDTEHIDTGTWTPGTLKAGVYSIQAHIPVNGATANEVTYAIYPGDGSIDPVTINQHVGGNEWVPLGDFSLDKKGAKVVLTNANKEPPGTSDIAYDAVAFTLIKSDDSTEQQLAEKFEPELRFDSSEKWRPLNLETFFGERESKGNPAQHRCIPYESPDASTILGESPPYKQTSGDFRTLIPAVGGDEEVDVARCQPAATLEEATAWRSPDAYIDIGELGTPDEVTSYHSPYSICLHNGLYDCNGNEQPGDPYSAIYYYISDSSGYQFIQYWYFYRFNSFSNEFLLAKSHHEGDWEAAAVAPSADGTHFNFVSFSQHGKWYSYLRSVLICEDEPDGNCGTEAAPKGHHVADFVANGDHSNYAYACSEELQVPPYTCGRGDGELVGDRGHDGTQYWGHDFSGEGLLPMPAPGTGKWSDWPGHWGATAAEENSPWREPGYGSPNSPASQSMFAKPWGSCGEDVEDDTCALPARAGAPGKDASNGLVASAMSCDGWFGSDVAAVLCAPQALATTVREKHFAGDSAASLHIRRRDASAAAGAQTTASGAVVGLAQALGIPLHIGDEVVLSGNVPPRALLEVRAVSRSGKPTVLLAKPPAGHRELRYKVIRFGSQLRLRRSG